MAIPDKVVLKDDWHSSSIIKPVAHEFASVSESWPYPLIIQ